VFTLKGISHCRPKALALARGSCRRLSLASVSVGRPQQGHPPHCLAHPTGCPDCAQVPAGHHPRQGAKVLDPRRRSEGRPPPGLKYQRSLGIGPNDRTPQSRPHPKGGILPCQSETTFRTTAPDIPSHVSVFKCGWGVAPGRTSTWSTARWCGPRTPPSPTGPRAPGTPRPAVPPPPQRLPPSHAPRPHNPTPPRRVFVVPDLYPNQASLPGFGDQTLSLPFLFYPFLSAPPPPGWGAGGKDRKEADGIHLLSCRAKQLWRPNRRIVTAMAML